MLLDEKLKMTEQQLLEELLKQDGNERYIAFLEGKVVAYREALDEQRSGDVSE